ncbi:Gryzun, putative trafficking through golgi-domain-containing protein [Scleroderma yunnanense]
MNSYPAEMLVQLAPIMFVAGLDPPQATTAAGSPPPKTQDPFSVLTTRLRDALLSQRKPAIWNPERTKTFQVALVDRVVGFPPRKSVSPDDPSYSNAHSPLSPLTSSSPVYPDGLIAPIWIRKHTTYVPSVVVLFLRMYEAPHSTPSSPLDQPDAEMQRERVEEERRRDTELSAEIAQRKKSTGERGIKLTVVLIARRKMLDDASLDGRLSYIRKQSGLDSRAALFVLSPVSAAELNEFVHSLQDALYDSAIEYYTSHSKRVRRKRNRHSQTLSSYNPAPLVPVGAAVQRPLRPEGWTVRYEYKMAVFAEFRGEDEVALKHYQDAYTTLMIMFGSTAILPPRTKRWAEAKVLADTINVKITKLYLYNNEHALALSHHNSHMRRFADFSRGWGIGEETFEYWSWMARQHRVLAELLEQGSRSTLAFPLHTPVPKAATALGPGGAPLELDAVRMIGMNPSHALQHPGHYYYMSARCTEARRERFLASEGMSQGPSSAPGYANEKKVDHLTMILELYTKSYELFKQYSATTSQGRLTLWIAYRIAHTYYESSKFDMAVRFFERIAKTYRREKWNSMLRPLFTAWYACAQKLGDVELTVKLLVEMIAYGWGDMDDPGSLQDDLLEVLRSSVPSSADGDVIVDMRDCEPIWNTSLIFWRPAVKVGEEAAFQFTLIMPPSSDVSDLPIESVTIEFSNEYVPVTLHHSASESSELVRLVRVGQMQPIGSTCRPHVVVANLRWRPGDTMVISGTIPSSSLKQLSISGLEFTLRWSSWTIRINHDPCAIREGAILPPRWLSSMNPVRFIPVARDDHSTVVFRHRPHLLNVSFSHQAPALLDEEHPITIEITNNDDRHLEIVVDVLLQPVEVDEAVQYIICNNQRSSGLIKGIQCGTIAPGVSVAKTLILVSTGTVGDRTIDISVQSNISSNQLLGPSPAESHTSSSDSTSAANDTSEILQTLVISTATAFAVTQGVEYFRSLQPALPLADLSAIENESWGGGEIVVTTTIECSAACGVEIQSVKLMRQDCDQAKITQSSIEEIDDDIFPAEYLAGDQFCDICSVSLASREGKVIGSDATPGPGEYIVTWRRSVASYLCDDRFNVSSSRITSPGQYGSFASTRLSLPLLCPPQDGLIALMNIPSTAKLHVPIPMQLTIRNHNTIRSATVTVALDPNPLDAFVVAGLRSGRLPVILPGAEEMLTWTLIPIECGLVKVPRVRVLDHRQAPPLSDNTSGTFADTDGEPVLVMDARFERWMGDGSEGLSGQTGENDVPIDTNMILVLPS